jgi:hypothetical protein
MELGKHLTLPDFIYKDASQFLYISSQLEKDLLHEQNARRLMQSSSKIPQKASARKR